MLYRKAWGKGGDFVDKKQAPLPQGEQGGGGC